MPLSAFTHVHNNNKSWTIFIHIHAYLYKSKVEQTLLEKKTQCRSSNKQPNKIYGRFPMNGSRVQYPTAFQFKFSLSHSCIYQSIEHKIRIRRAVKRALYKQSRGNEEKSVANNVQSSHIFDSLWSFFFSAIFLSFFVGLPFVFPLRCCSCLI